MLRHIIPVSLVMAACASLIPTRANAISFTLTPIGSLQRSPGDRISFIVGVDPQNDGGLRGVEILGVSTGSYDSTELSFIDVIPLFNFREQPVTSPRDIAALLFDVTNPIKDGEGDVSARVNYRIGSVIGSITVSDNFTNPVLDVEPIPVPVPEPLTIVGTATAFGCGVLFKRKSSKKTVS